MNMQRSSCLVVPGLASLFLLGESALPNFNGAYAQIVPDGTLGAESSLVTPDAFVRGDVADLIEGGATRGSALFHSFQDFNVNGGQRVYFANPVGIENILSRVTGLNGSEINGLLGVDGAANLFLLNPNGIIFGPDACLDVDGAFLASTSDRFQFADGTEFRATDPNDAPLVTVSIPVGLQMGPDASAALISDADLVAGQDLTLYAGSVTSNGVLSAPNGAVQVTGVTGDVQVQAVDAQSAVLEATGNLVLEESQLVTMGDLSLVATDTVRIRDSESTPFVTNAGGDLTIQGNQEVDILALNHLDITPFQSGGDLTLISDGIISGDAHFDSGGHFSMLDMAGNPGTFVSLYDPIIRADGDVEFDDYTGASLLVEASGNITTTGTINITRPDTGSGVALLDDNAAVILRAGVNVTNATDTFPGAAPFKQDEGDAPTTFTRTTPTGAGNLTIGGDILADDTTASGVPGYIELKATGDIALNGNLTANSNSKIWLKGNAVIGSNGLTIESDLVTFDQTVDLNGKTLTVTADEINLTDTVTPEGGSITIAPLTVSQNITLGGNADSGVGVLDLTANELTKLNGVELTVGRADGTGTVNLSAIEDDTFSNSITLAGSGTLQGPNDLTNWSTTGDNAGKLDLDTDGTPDITFSNFSTVTGGNAQDVLIGNGGANTFALLPNADNTANADNTFEFKNITFNNIEQVNALGGDDILRGTNTADTFTITGDNAVPASGIIFNNIQEIAARGGDDTIIFTSDTFDGAITDGTGNLILTGEAITVGGDISGGSGNLTIETNELELEGTEVTGNGKLFIKPITAGSATILIGGNNDDDPEKDLELSNSEIGQLSGFSSITFSNKFLEDSKIKIRNSGITFPTESTITLDSDKIDIRGSITARSSTVNLLADEITGRNEATVDASSVEPSAPSGTVRIGSAIAADNTLELVVSIDLSNITVNAGDDGDGSTIEIAISSYDDLSPDYSIDPSTGFLSRLSADNISITQSISGITDDLEGFKEGNVLTPSNITVLPNDGGVGFTLNNFSYSNGFLFDGGDWYFSDTYFETGFVPLLQIVFGNANDTVLFAANQFEIQDLDNELVIPAAFPALRAGNAFSMNTGDSISTTGNLQIASVGPSGNGTTAIDILANPSDFSFSPSSTVTLGGVTSSGGSIQLASLGNLTTQGSVTAANNLVAAAVGTLTLNGLSEAETGDVAFRSADNLQVLESGASVRGASDISFDAGGNLEILGTGTGIVAMNGGIINADDQPAVEFNAEGAITIIGNGADITTNGGDVSFDAGGTLEISGTGTGIDTDGGNVEIDAGENQVDPDTGNAITLGIDINTSPTAPINSSGGNIRVTAELGDVTITSELSSLNAAPEVGGGFSELEVEALAGNVILSDALITAANSETATGVELAGDIRINATGEIQIINGTTLSTDGFSGRIFIGPEDETPATVPTLISIEDSVVRTSNAVINSAANSGSIQIRGDRVEILSSEINAESGEVVQQSTTPGGGNAGSITITSLIRNDSVNADLLIDNSDITALTASLEDGAAGDAGEVTLSAESKGRILLRNDTTVSSNTTGAGNSGNVRVESGDLSLEGGSVIQAGSEGTGAPGSVDIIVSDTVSVDGIGSLANLSEISTSSGASAFTSPQADEVSNPGTITIQGLNNQPTRSISLTNRGRINALTSSNELGSTGGSIDVKVRQLDITSGGQIIAASEGTATAGSVTINAIENVNISGAALSFADAFLNTSTIRQYGNVDLEVDGNRQLQQILLTSGTGALSVSELEQSLGLQPNEIRNANSSFIATEGAGVEIVLNDVLSEDALVFDWNFLTNESTPTNTYNDFAFQSVNQNSLGVLADTNSGGFIATPPPFNKQTTGNFTDSVLTQGENSIRFGVVDVTDTAVSSGLEITNFKVGGNPITVVAPQDDIQIEEAFVSGINVSGGANGVGGNLTINTPELTVEDGGEVVANAEADGAAGRIEVNATSVKVSGFNAESGGNSQIASSVESNTAGSGSVVITADTVEVSGGGAIAATTTDGTAGNVNVTGNTQVDVMTGGVISTSATGSGAAGAVTASADTVAVTGQDSTIASTVQSNQSGRGTVTVNAANTLTVSAAGTIETSSTTGTAGSITTEAPTITVTGEGTEIAASSSSGGRAGNVNLTASNFQVIDGAVVTVNSPTGLAGSLSVIADQATLNRGTLTSVAGAGDGSANISIDLSRSPAFDNFLRLENESLISASALGSATGGNITIKADFILATFPTGSEGSDIAADAQLGSGGVINIAAPLGVFGLQVRPERTPLNDITATGGVQGSISINTLTTSPDEGVVELDLAFVDVSDQTIDRCASSGDGNASEISVAGRGGLPPMPTGILSAVADSDDDWVTLASPAIDAMGSTPTTMSTLSATTELSQTPSLCHRGYQAMQTPI